LQTASNSRLTIGTASSCALVFFLSLLWSLQAAAQQAVPLVQLNLDSASDTAAVATADKSEQIPVDATDDRQRLSWDVRIDQFVGAKKSFVADLENPDELFVELDTLLHIREKQFELILDDAGSRSEKADSHTDVLAAIFPGTDTDVLPLPASVVSVLDAHENYLALYSQRIRLLNYVSKDLYKDITGTDLFGMRQLYFELSSVWLELRYQALRIPDAGKLVMRMATRAPLPLVWFFLQLVLLAFLFRWWRRWFPETINRMQAYLRNIRPRSSEVVGRMRALWYVQEVRSPLEWLAFSYALIGLVSFLELEFIPAITQIILLWVLLAWFFVVLLDAVVARGAGGLASDIGRTRLHSLRWIAVWLVLLGLGLGLAERLAGQAALYALVVRMAQILAFPLLILQLGLWRTLLFQRAEREDPDFMPQRVFDSQRGPGKYIGAAKLCGFLVATSLRKSLLSSLEQFGTSIANAAIMSVSRDSQVQQEHSLDPALADLLLAVSTDYAKYSRAARRQLVERINNGLGGSIVVIGERGIGKNGFIRQVCEQAGAGYLMLDCQNGTAYELEAELARGLGLTMPLEDKQALRRAFTEKQISVLAMRNLHMLVRPVVGGMAELTKVARIIDMMPDGVIRLMGMDRYAWFYTKAVLAERATSVEIVDLPEWTEEQIEDIINDRCEQAGVQIDFTRLRVPSQYLDAGEDTAEGRNRAGISRMCARLSGGNPTIAMRFFVRCLEVDDSGQVYATLPANRETRDIEHAALHVLLVLRVIAQAEQITPEVIAANLRYPSSVIDSALQLVVDRQWVVEQHGRYSLALPWFRPITRVLARRNLLAGVRQDTA
jgi:hypothetical protein